MGGPPTVARQLLIQEPCLVSKAANLRAVLKPTLDPSSKAGAVAIQGCGKLMGPYLEGVRRVLCSSPVAHSPPGIE